MKLRFVWQIFRKDARHLWWVIGLTLLLLSRLVHFDSWRAGATPESSEGWLNILLPLAWSFLIAMAVLEDPVVGDTPFWVTVPCRWPSIVAAKAAFIVVFIHLPYLIGCIAITQARGFDASGNISVLLDRQLALLALTVASAALATMVGNVTRFMIVAIAIAAVLGAPSSSQYMSSLSDGPETHVIRETVVFAMTTLAAAGIAISQYWRRRTSVARGVGIAAILLAGVIWWLPREDFDGLQATFSAAPAIAGQISIHLPTPEENHEKRYAFYMAGGRAVPQFAIPLSVSGLAQGSVARFRQSDMTLQEADGREDRINTVYDAFRSANIGSSGSAITDFWTSNPELIPSWQLMMLDDPVRSRVGNKPVNIKASALVTTYRRPNENWSSVGQSVTVPGLGKCIARLAGYNPASESLAVNCEAPGSLPAIVHIRVIDPAADVHWDRTLGDSVSLEDYPVNTWLSPVARGEAFFGLTDEEHYNRRNQFGSIPREHLGSVKVGITPEIPEGSSVVRYELPNIVLSQYEVKR